MDRLAQDFESKIKAHELVTLAFAIFVVSTVFTVTELSQVWLVIPILILICAVAFAIYYGYNRIRSPMLFFIALFILYFIYIYHGLSQPTDIELVARVLIFIPVSLVCIYIFPNVVDKAILLKILSVVASLVGLVGIPSAILGGYLPFVTTHREARDAAGYSLFGIEVHLIESILSNPNPLGELLFFGIISSLIWRSGSHIRWFLIGVCGVGLILTQSRAALLATLAAFFIYIVGATTSRQILQKIVLICSIFGTIGYFMLLRLLPTPAIIDQIHLAGRLPIWHAAIDAVAARPLIGHGPGDMPTIVGAFADRSVGAGVYNSFLRLFVTTGIIGGICYLYLFIYSVVQYPKRIYNHESLLIYALLIGFIVNELFSGNSIFGLSNTSVVGAILIGYVITDITNK